MSMYKEDFEKPNVCYWCGKIIDGSAVINKDLFMIFGYIYCSNECYEQHIGSK